MVTIAPFKGLRYAPQQPLDKVTAPPYDVIEPAFQQALYDRNPHNIVRLILNQKQSTDVSPEVLKDYPNPEAENTYTRAAGFLSQWRQTGVMTSDTAPCLYAYSQLWQEPGQLAPTERKGFIALLKLEPYDTQQVLPHEYTLGGPKVDRLHLMNATQCNLSQVFLLYNDPTLTAERLLFGEASADTAWHDVVDDGGVTHHFAPVSNPQTIQAVQTLFSDKITLIADGHHRYETALQFKQNARTQWQAEHPSQPLPADGDLPTDYMMVFLANMDDDGLKVYPTHRLLNAWPPGWNKERFETELLKRFMLVDSDETFRYQYSATSAPLKLKLRDASLLTSYTPPVPDVLSPMDVAQLEAVVFQDMLGNDADTLKQKGLLWFERDEAQVYERLQTQQSVAAFLMSTPSVAQVRDVCQAGYRMPQKSTYFSPKILSGLVLYPYA
jgi:uncharacterized protein (DUF1015 family)